ncbi:MAG TPA: M48 family metallopeptidase [Methylophilaceae bacterium]|jgi:predicted Zn-dependent protease
MKTDHQRKTTTTSYSIPVLLLALFALTPPANAFNLGDALKDAVKKEQDKLNPAPNTDTPTSTDASSTATTTEETSKPAFNLSSPSKEEEIQLGREITGNLLGAAPLVKDEALQKYVNQVGRWVASQSERPDLPWHFGVIESEDLNAFSAPGGYVLITKGLYRKLENEAQLAGVLGHEIGHVIKKHHLKLLQKSQLINFGASLLGSKLGKTDLTVQKVIGNGAEIMARGLDKDAEFEADRIGMTLATRAGYDPFGLTDVLQTIGQTNKNDSSVALLYKTHPSPDDRLAKLSDAVGSRFDKVKDGKTLSERLYKLKD